MSDHLVIKNQIRNFNKKIEISGDKSISIRWVLLSSIAEGVSTAENLLMSEDVVAAIKAIKKLGIKVILKKKFVKFMEKVLTVIDIKKILQLMLKILEHLVD